MPKDYNKEIESFSIDYRDEATGAGSTNRPKSVTGRSTGINSSKRMIQPTAQVAHSRKESQSQIKAVPIRIKKEYNSPREDIYIKTKAKVPYRAIIVAMTIILTVIGATIFISTINKADIMATNPVNYNTFNGFLYPVVMQDPEEFESPETADKDMVTAASIWMTIFKNTTEQYNSFDDQGYALIPISEIKESCEALFGDDSLIDTTQTIHGPFFYFNVGEEAMHVGAISNQGRPIPQIKDVTEEEKKMTFTVDYIIIGSAEEDSDQKEVIKTMKYILNLNEKTEKYYIYSVSKM